MSYLTQVQVPEGEFDVILVFAPTRTHFGSIRVGHTNFRSSDLTTFLWVGSVPRHEVSADGSIAVRIDAVGERPILLRLQLARSHEVDDVLVRLDNALFDWAALLNSRAEFSAAYDSIRRFFFYFDAWTIPELAQALRTQKLTNRLTEKAKSVFLPSPGANDPSGVFVRMAGQLVDLAVSRAHNLVHADPMRPELDPLMTPERIANVAQYLRSIFERVPRNLTGGPGNDLVANLEVAFAYFASGHLAFLSTDGDQVALNAEPNSDWFFAFAEFALRAYEFDAPEHRDQWFELARLFTVLVEPFSIVYGPSLEGRGPCGYRRENRRDMLRPPIEAVMSAIELQHRLIPDTDPFDKLEQLFGATMTWAVRDEAIQSNSICKDPDHAEDPILITPDLSLVSL